jgi:hypothetical protein
MSDTHSAKGGGNEGRATWYVAPLVWAAIAGLAFGIAPNWHDLLAEPAQGQHRGSGAPPSVAPHASGSETSVPSASSVPSYPVEEHVQAF